MLDRYIADAYNNYGALCEAITGSNLVGGDEFTRIRLKLTLASGGKPAFALDITRTDPFSINKSKRRITVGRDMLHRLAVAMDNVRLEGDATEDLDRACLYLFLTHELLHSSQGLSSRWFQDVDHFRATVAQVDYAADAAAISFVLALVVQRPNQWPYLSKLDWSEQIERLIAVHLAVMKAFYFTWSGSSFLPPEQIRLSRFIRVSTWIYQAARAHAIDGQTMTSSEFNLTRPVMVEFPKGGLKALGTGWVQRGTDGLISFKPEPEAADGSPPDTVVTSVWPDGLPWIARFNLPSKETAEELTSGAFEWGTDRAYDAWSGLFDSRQELVSGPASDLDRAGRLVLRMADALLIECHFDAIHKAYTELTALVGLTNRDPIFVNSPYSRLIDAVGDLYGKPELTEERMPSICLLVLQTAYALRR